MDRAVHPLNSRTASRRRASAVVELAVCLPILVTLLLATTETCTMIHLQQSLKISAFEGARVGTVPGATAADVRAQCAALLDAHNVQNYSIQLAPANPETLQQGDYLQVTVSAEFGPNSLVGGWLFEDKILRRSVSLSAE